MLSLRTTLLPLALTLATCAVASSQTAASVQPLNTGWKLISGCTLQASGEAISSTSDHAVNSASWINAQVPGTVLGSQVAAGIFPDPYHGMNLRNIPGTDYPITKIYGYLPMPESSPYHCPWWYRVQFSARKEPGHLTWLHFNGINYRANLWLNGKQLASTHEIEGVFRSYDFNITDALHSDGKNTLAIQVFAQTEKDLGIDFLDWNPAPADKSMGLWRDVSLARSGSVTLRNPAIFTHFSDDSLSEADLTIVADIANHADRPVTTTVTATIAGHTLTQPLTLSANQSTTVRFTPDHYPQLRWQHPPLWWPWQYGEPHLETLTLTAHIGNILSDRQTTDFGIREIDSFLNPDGARQFRINHRNILIRGAGWNPDLLYREPEDRLRSELEYVRDMHLNTIRLEGKLGSDALFHLADRMGIFILPGWQCCDYWQKTEKWNDHDLAIAQASQYSQITRLRAHPSILAWLNGSDEAPAAKVEQAYLEILKERDWPNPILNSAADTTSKLTGKSGVKMTGPYDYVPPEYWYLDDGKKHENYGGAWGFNTETSPGPAPPIASSIRRTLDKKDWWPIDAAWNYHAGLGKFAQLDHFTEAMNATYGPADSLSAYAMQSQLLAYDSERAMFEAYSAHKYHSTGVVQWMLNNAWPGFIWHLYDYYLVPGGGYYATRKANEPLHIEYRYDDRTLCIINSTLHAYQNLHATARLIALDGSPLESKDSTLSIEADGVANLFTIPEQKTTTFLKLELHDAKGTLLSDNFYWLPAHLAELNWPKTTYVYTPAIHYADMHDLHNLLPATVKAHILHSPQQASITLENSGKSVAFFLALRAVKSGTDEDIAPVFWSDNYISLLPGESRTLTLRNLPASEKIDIKLAGWNLIPITLAAE
jgi:exo-1,4-beta-D-glucosaminidase